MRVLDSVCPLDCPDACAVKITVEDGKMIHLGGSSSHPVTRGFACVKMAKYPLRQESTERLTVPLKRVGKKGEGRFQPISWEQALDTITSELSDRISR
ncbi:MAG TPA: molybdopterin oxidoreductase, partial [Planctomycetaceae bacterium]|nr:molybdopterin oxidoreductase [Planctomycetaceae bacterium]